MPNWYHQSIQQEAGIRENIAAMLASLMMSLPAEEAVAQTAKNLKVPVQQVQSVAQTQSVNKSQHSRTLTWEDFFKTLQRTETGASPNGGHGAIGDNGEALGPFQIHFEYFWDAAGVAGTADDYNKCAGLDYSKAIVKDYLTRKFKGNVEQAIASGNWLPLAAIHHSIAGQGNPAYVAKFKQQMRQLGYR